MDEMAGSLSDSGSGGFSLPEGSVAPRDWIRRHLKIIPKMGSIIPLEANTGQLMLDLAIETQRASGNPVRIILLKPRQVGWSTWSEARAFEYINNNAERTALVVSADNDSTNFVFTMARTFQSEMKDPLPTDASSRREIIYKSPHRSRFLTQTAGKDVLGRGGTVHFFHGSEVAFWPNASVGAAAVLQMVPNDIDTTVIFESTACGVGGYFYDMYWQARDRFAEMSGRDDGERYAGYIPVFFPWYKFGEYRILPPKGFSMDEEERELAKKYDLDAGQLFWRRIKIQELGGDEGLFRQEYPSTSLEAFQVAGNPVFGPEAIKRQRAKQAKTPRHCILEGGNAIVDVDRSFNCWKIARLPVHSHEYTIGIDTMESRLSDVANPKSPLDRHAVAIFDRNDGQYVAMYHGQGPQVELARQCLRTAELYNEAWVAPELPKGFEVLKFFREHGYSNIYQRQVHDEQDMADDSDNLGWRTTLITRSWLIESFRTAMLEDSITITFKDILDEMDTFAFDKTGKAIHRPGKHDDLLFAAMIALQIHLRTPMGVKPYELEYTGEEIEHVKEKSLAMIGAVDPGVEYEDGYTED